MGQRRHHAVARGPGGGGVPRLRGGDSRVEHGRQEPGHDRIGRVAHACVAGAESGEAGSLMSGPECHSNGWRRWLIQNLNSNEIQILPNLTGRIFLSSKILK
jgi:hypothetical protein